MQRVKQVIDRLVEGPAIQATPPPAQIRQPAAIVRSAEPQANSLVTTDFLNYIKKAENPNFVGWDKTRKRWYPHKDPSGGFNIGYGHHFQTNEEYQKYAKQGMSNEEVEKLLVDDILKAKKVVQQYIQRRYKVNLQLSLKQEQMLVDYVFNMGGLDKFPKMVDAVLRSDKEKMRKEYKRYAKIGGEVKEIKGRNDQFAAAFMRESELCESRAQDIDNDDVEPSEIEVFAYLEQLALKGYGAHGASDLAGLVDYVLSNTRRFYHRADEDIATLAARAAAAHGMEDVAGPWVRDLKNHLEFGAFNGLSSARKVAKELIALDQSS